VDKKPLSDIRKYSCSSFTADGDKRMAGGIRKRSTGPTSKTQDLSWVEGGYEELERNEHTLEIHGALKGDALPTRQISF